MTILTSNNLYWDSCVIGRFLTGNPTEYVADIATLLEEAKEKKRRIWTSTLMIVEVRPWQLQQKGYDNFQELIEDFESCLHLVGPTPPILMQAARLRNFSYYRTLRQKDEKPRVLSGMDAVHLATCLHVKNVLGKEDILFHTFDDGRGKNYEERAVSLLKYHEYSTHIANDPDVAAVCSLPRAKPAHAAPKLGLE